jgi:hypothetical protein
MISRVALAASFARAICHASAAMDSIHPTCVLPTQNGRERGKPSSPASGSAPPSSSALRLPRVRRFAPSRPMVAICAPLAVCLA